MLDIIGTLFTGPTFDAEGNATTEAQALAGWHVNAPFRIDGWSQYEVTPNTPRRVFAGVQTVFYTFPDEATFKALVEETVTDSEGNTTTVPKELKPEQAPVAGQAVPLSVSPRQLCQAMNRVPYGEGFLRDAVEAAVLAGDQDIKDWWHRSTAFERHHPQVLVMASALGVSEADLDQLWTLAGGL